MRNTWLAIICLIAGGALSVTQAQMNEAATMEQGRELTALFYAGELATVWQRFDHRMQGALGSQQNLAAFRTKVDQELGQEKEIIRESAGQQQGYNVYVRLSKFDKINAPIVVQWAMTETGQVAGFQIQPQPEISDAFEDYRTQTSLRLPFDGPWYVFWGGRQVEQNYHVTNKAQRYAYDLLVYRSGRSFRGGGTANEDYYCWGKDILAPAAGTVVTAEDGVDDNVPGEMNPEQILGNHVIIDHGNGEFSLLAHLQKGSVAVNAGDSLASGQKLGRCGNSGNSSEPHLHYHLQNAAEFGQGHGLPAPFNGYRADGQHVDRGEPVKGQTIEAVPAE